MASIACDESAVDHLIYAFPELKNLLLSELINWPEFESWKSLDDAVVSIVISQMLSNRAAATITARLKQISHMQGQPTMACASDEQLREAGLSGRKIKTIRSYQSCVQKGLIDEDTLKGMSYEELAAHLDGKIWGFSDWSVSMLAIFYLHLADVFPRKDGAIQRACQFIEAKFFHTRRFCPEDAAPHRTLLALYLWKFVDKGVVQD